MNNYIPSQYDSFVTSFVEGTSFHNDTSRAAYYSMLDFDLQGKKILDVGCGDGYDLAQLAKQGAQCYGIDAAQSLVSLAQKNAPEAHVMYGIMESLPYANNSFDVVLSKYALQTTEQLPQVLEEMGRVLKPNGVMAYLTVHPLRQFLEKKKHPKDYFLQEVVNSVFFGGTVTAREPTHTMDEYLNSNFLKKYHILHFKEHIDFPSSERIEGDNYPCFFVLKARKLSE